MNKLKPRFLFLFLEGTGAFLFAMIFSASAIYQVTVAELSPLQLVLVGTTLEAAIFIFEIPTGVVADVYSRRLSIIIGYVLIGLGFFLEGSFPIFLPILIAQVIWGIGYTFTSGATQAWITDEIGEAAANNAFLRSNQISQVTSLAGLGAGAWLGSLKINLPIQYGGFVLILLAVFLIFFMPETGFRPAPRDERSSWKNLTKTFRSGLGMLHRRPALLDILLIGLFFGLYSEGFDRLWTKLLLDNFIFPTLLNLKPVFWINLMRASGMLLSIAATEGVIRRVNTANHRSIARALLSITIVLITGLVFFALAGKLILVVIAYLVIYISRNVIGPLYTAWVNQSLDSQVRATVLSMSSQVDAIGQIAGGPVVGLIGNWFSVQAAIVTSAFSLTPVLPLIAHTSNKEFTQAVVVVEEKGDQVT